MISAKVRLVAALVLFLGWIVWLGYTAVAKNRGPVVSHAQAAAATSAVVAEVTAADGKPTAEVTVVESLHQDGPAVGSKLTVLNLPDAHGFVGPDTYLLLLAAEPGGLAAQASYVVVGPQRSPGYDLAGTGHPAIYKWTPEVEVQARKLFP
jgi:hypothetical protein